MNLFILLKCFLEQSRDEEVLVVMFTFYESHDLNDEESDIDILKEKRIALKREKRINVFSDRTITCCSESS